MPQLLCPGAGGDGSQLEQGEVLDEQLRERPGCWHPHLVLAGRAEQCSGEPWGNEQAEW